MNLFVIRKFPASAKPKLIHTSFLESVGGACETKPSRAYMHCAMMEYEDSDIEFARVRTS